MASKGKGRGRAKVSAIEPRGTPEMRPVHSMTPRPPKGLERPLVDPLRLRKALKGLRDTPGVRGAIACTMDGYPLDDLWPGLPDPETFCAMHAAAVSACQLALDDGADNAQLGVVLDLGDRRVVSRQITKDVLVIMGVDPATDWETALLMMDAAALEFG